MVHKNSAIHITFAHVSVGHQVYSEIFAEPRMG